VVAKCAARREILFNSNLMRIPNYLDIQTPILDIAQLKTIVRKSTLANFWLQHVEELTGVPRP